MSSIVKSPSIAATSELRAAYNELRAFYAQKNLDFLTNSEEISSNPNQTQPDKTSNFTSTILSSDGAYFTADLMGTQKVTDVAALEPVSTEKESVAGDVTCYGPGPESGATATGTYKKLSENSSPSTLEGAAATILAEISTHPNPEEQAKKDQAKEVSYTVKPGDSLSKIAQSKLGNLNRWGEIYDLNREVLGSDPNVITPGKVLKLPSQNNTASSSAKTDVNPASSPVPTPSAVEKEITAFSNGKINSNPKGPDSLNNPHLSLYQYSNPHITVGTAASDYCNIFFNGIDNINLSLCVPYLRINVIDRFSKKQKKYPAMSLISFLKSSNQPDKNDKIFYNSQPVLFDARTGGLTSIQQKLANANVIGMEAFQSPNTLLPDPTVILDNPRRLDTSVPLMTLESFAVSIESNGVSALSKKMADLSIVLHDRSRLKDISTLVSMGSFSSLYFSIEWGWSHPHAAAQFNNPVAKYLNALRSKELFLPMSYNMTLQNGGGVQINLRLVGSGIGDMINTPVSTGSFVTKSMALDYFNRFIKSTIDSDPALRRETVAETRPITTILTSKNRKGQLIKREFIDKILSYVRQDDVNTQEKTSQIISDLQEIIDDPQKQFSNKDGIKAIEQNLKKINVSGFGEATFEKMKAKYAGLNAQDFTSVGTYLNQAIGSSLASTGLYDEVQIHTFTFNNQAGAMSSLPISDACIRISDLIGQENEAGSLYESDSIARALSSLCTILSNPLLQTYMTERRVEPTLTNSTTEAAVASVDKLIRDKIKSNAGNQSQVTTDSFTVPNIRHVVRAVPAKIFSDETTSLADVAVDDTRVIAQIFIYDANSASEPDALIAAYDRSAKIKDAPKVTYDRAKEIAKLNYPSITYGSLNSVIENISVSTDINGAIQTQAIVDFQKSLDADNIKSDKVVNISELAVFPVSISVSMIGMPIIERGQEIYLDLGTGTTLDAVYYVLSVKHDLRNMKFITNLTLIPKGQGTVQSMEKLLESYANTQSNQTVFSSLVTSAKKELSSAIKPQ